MFLRFIFNKRLILCIRPIQIEEKASIVPLVAGLRKDVQNLVSEGVGLVWESYKLVQYVQRFSECVIQFQEKVSKPSASKFTCDFLFNTLVNLLIILG